MKSTSKVPHIDWLNPLKACALLAILLNHLVEEFGSGPWFTNPSENWPDFATRITRLFPKDYPFPFSLIQFLGWLGDSGPGVFILASGFGLTWAVLHKSQGKIQTLDFYKRRLLRIFPLYIAMHVVILAGSLVVSTSELTLANPLTFLSLVGLRFTDGLFFYINPSWWFIWLILQLYVIFPFLYFLIHKFGLKTFFIITCSFTILSRLLGLLGIRYSNSLYYDRDFFRHTIG
jgi:peptidoglycan/LPS O-acetylase OafA/YrhL